MNIDKNYLILGEIDSPTYNKDWWAYYAHVYLVQLQNDYTGIIDSALTDDFTYETDLNVNSVSVNQSIYTSVDSISDIISTDSAYYYDRANSILYVHFVDHTTPWHYSESEIKVNLVFGVYKSNYNNDEFDGTLIGQQYSPRLAQAGKIATAKDDLFTGKQKFQNSSITILDGDYRLQQL